ADMTVILLDVGVTDSVQCYVMCFSSVEGIVRGTEMRFKQGSVIGFVVYCFLFIVVSDRLKEGNTYLTYCFFVILPQLWFVPNRISQTDTMKFFLRHGREELGYVRK